MRDRPGTINGWIPAARMQFRSSPIGRASLGQVQSRWPVISEAPAACCARTLTGQSSRGSGVVGYEPKHDDGIQGGGIAVMI